MDSKFTPLWDFILERGLNSLNADSFREFLQKRECIFFQDIEDFSTEDIITLFFVELESLLDNMVVDITMPPKDQLFDCLMQIADYYSPVRYIFPKLETDVLTMPSHYCLFVFFKNKIVKRIEEICHIYQIELIFSDLTFMNNFFKNGCVLLPNLAKNIALSMFLIHFLKQWMKDTSQDFENTMVTFEEMMQYCSIT